MAHLSLVGTSDDGERLLLVDDAGAAHTLGIDARLRAALRGETSRPAQLETQMDSALRPRDIQARIRAGETPEAVAQAAQTTVEKIMAFAGPVIAERQHVAERAQRSSVRRRSGESAGGARTLGDAVGAHLRGLNVDPASVEWDAWRREDGRWSLTARFATARREGVASFTFDAPGSYVTLDDDDARWLIGEAVAEPRGAGPGSGSGDDLTAARARRLTSVGEDDVPLGDDAIELVSEPPLTQPFDEPVAEPVEEEAFSPEPEPVEADTADPAETGEEPVVEPAARQGGVEDPEQPQLPGTEVEGPEGPEGAEGADGPPRRPVQKKRGRASVPSWDEIMFGGRDQ